MAKVRANLLIQGLSGSLGDQFVLRHLRDGRTIVCVKPNFSNRKFSREQLAHQQRFREAADFARKAAKEQPVYAELAGDSLKSAYNIALSDWFHPPVIERVERRGDTIRVLASDNVRVARVWGSILNGNIVVDESEASLVGANWWEFAAPEPSGRLVVKVLDLAGNLAETEVDG